MTRRYWLPPLVVLLVFASYQFRSQARQNPQNPAQIEVPASPQQEQQESRENFFQGEERVRAQAKVERLKEIQTRREAKILAQPGVLSIGIGRDEVTRDVIFVVRVDQGKPMPKVPSTIEGVPIRVEKSTRAVPMNGGQGCVPCHHELEGYPIQMGNSFSEGYSPAINGQNICGACTMGFKAYRTSTGVQEFVTCAHCQRKDADGGCPGQKAIDTQNYHPALLDHSLADGCLLAAVDSKTVGLTKAEILEDFNGRNLDAAMIASDSGTTDFGLRDIGTPSTIPGSAMPGDVVQKSGRTSGQTKGTVSNINQTQALDYDCSGSLTFTGTILVDPLNGQGDCTDPPCVMALGGDSGSALVSTDSPPKIVGLLFGGGPGGSFAVALPINRVLDAFGITLNPNHIGACRDIVPPAVTTFNADPVTFDVCGAIVNYVLPDSLGDCGGDNTVLCDPPPGNFFPVGNTTINCGSPNGIRTPLGSFTLTVVDNVPPIITQANISVSTTPNRCDAVVTFAPTATDNCDQNLSAPSCSPSSGSTFPKGTTTVTCTLSDSKNNQASKMFTVSVNDNQGPVFSAPTNTTQSTDTDKCTAVVNFAPAATDNCDGTLTLTGGACTPPSGSTFSKGLTTVNCGADDSAHNHTDYSFTVNVNDTQKPNVTCPSNFAQGTDSTHCSAVVSFTATALDNCDGSRPVTCTPSSGSTFNKGTTTVNCSASDTSNNTGTGSFTVTVNDTTPPSITCPANVTHGTDPNQCSAVVTYANATATDNCTNVGTPSCTPASGSIFPKGATMVNCSVSDASNNPGACSFTVTVNDTQAPAIACNNVAGQSAFVGGSCSASVPDVTGLVRAQSSDNCTASNALVITQVPAAASTVSGVGAHPITVTVKDAATNATNCVVGFTLVDNTPPVFVNGCLAPINVAAAATCPISTSAVVAYAAPAATDNCPGVTVACIPPSGSSFAVGTTTVNCTATDASANKAMCSFPVTVFGLCVQDDSNPGNVVLVNAATGAYRFCCNGVLVASGTGVLSARGCVVSISDNASRRVTISVDVSANKGSASIQQGSVMVCTITDRNLANNSCVCQ